MKNQLKISAKKTRLVGLFHLVTGKIISRYTWSQAQAEDVVQRELRRCEQYLDQNFERLSRTPDGRIVAEFEEDLPSEELSKRMEESQ